MWHQNDESLGFSMTRRVRKNGSRIGSSTADMTQLLRRGEGAAVYAALG
jgi:hypothetical protein